ncbi:MAG: hypothetical protein ABIT01_05485, partial [Thermoanaerobaculia bacterium]
GETVKDVGRKVAGSAVIAAAGGVIAWFAGVRGIRDLAIVTFAVAGFAANFQTIVLFVRRRAIATMGGYLSHAGVSIMLLGILISGVYEKKGQVTLERGRPTRVGRNTMTFTRALFVTEDGTVKRQNELDMTRLADRRAKQSMEIEVLSPRGKVWKAYPKIYMNAKTNQMMANPDVDSSAAMDLYISPQSYDPGTPARSEGSLLAMKKGEAKTVNGVGFKFLDFEADRSQVASARPRVIVTAHFLVTTADQAIEQAAQLVMPLGAAGAQGPESPETPVPGTKARIRMKRVSATEGTCEIEVLGLNPAGDVKAATVESFSADITTKPLISLVWAGFYVMMGGAVLSFLRRARDSRRAALA